ncbi:MAG: hypothetical protein AAFX78_15080 [Cyanobacteria bacterium J06638_20]
MLSKTIPIELPIEPRRYQPFTAPGRFSVAIAMHFQIHPNWNNPAYRSWFDLNSIWTTLALVNGCGYLAT